MNKNKSYKTIGEVAKILNLVDTKSGRLLTHTIRFWEKEVKEVKPYIFAGKRRYYDNNKIEILKKIQFLLKNQGMTIKGAKKYLQNNNSKLDVEYNKTINKKKLIEARISKISKILKSIKTNG